MEVLKHCVHCGRRIPKRIEESRFFCSPNCYRKYVKKNGNPQHHAREFFEKEYGVSWVKVKMAKDLEFAESLVCNCRHCMARTRVRSENPEQF
ncbi:MAG: DUF2116 family Zn-ribbon domain-containing protein [Lentisphaeria bacterium]|nr:DUF2116 family Zn-ribbon domain-containing protein [Lentisphaeria bacterium]